MTNVRADELIDRILRNEDDTGKDANELLPLLGGDYPVSNLRRLFVSDHDEVVKTAAWIASELGTRATPLLSDVVQLLHHRVPYVRAFATDVVLVAATPVNAHLIAGAVHLIADEDKGVRWKATDFLARATAEQLCPSRYSIAIYGDPSWTPNS